MAEKKEEEKPVQKADKKEEEKPTQKKKGKYDMALKSTLTPDELLKPAANTPNRKKKKTK